MTLTWGLAWSTQQYQGPQNPRTPGLSGVGDPPGSKDHTCMMRNVTCTSGAFQHHCGCSFLFFPDRHFRFRFLFRVSIRFCLPESIIAPLLPKSWGCCSVELAKGTSKLAPFSKGSATPARAALPFSCLRTPKKNSRAAGSGGDCTIP